MPFFIVPDRALKLFNFFNGWRFINFYLLLLLEMEFLSIFFKDLILSEELLPFFIPPHSLSLCFNFLFKLVLVARISSFSLMLSLRSKCFLFVSLMLGFFSISLRSDSCLRNSLISFSIFSSQVDSFSFGKVSVLPLLCLQ